VLIVYKSESMELVEMYRVDVVLIYTDELYGGDGELMYFSLQPARR
jgi:hypothetical protein